MNIPPRKLEASYAACRRIVRQAGSNFPATFLLLPRGQRLAMEALYAFMRHSDDLADDPRPGQLPADALVHWRAAFEQALLGCFEPPSVNQRITADAPAAHGWFYETDETGKAILPAVVHALGEYHIPPEHLRAVLDGVEMDLKRRRYETFDELRAYCERVASAVGLACIHVWGFTGPAALGPARDAGIAFQLTNILRDLKEDAERDRIYLPLADLRQCGYTEEELSCGKVTPGFLRLMEFEIRRAAELFGQAATLQAWLEPGGRRIFGMMMATYRALLAEIARRPGDVFARRIRLSWSKKLRIAARWSWLPPRKPAPG